MKKSTALPKLPARRRDAHKGDFGRVLIIGGSTGMIGAPALAANATLRAGAGLVVVGCPAPIQPFVATLCPCATTVPLPFDRYDRLDPRTALAHLWAEGLLEGERKSSAIAIGPGLSLGDERWCRNLVKLMQSLCGAAPLVIDADALNAISVAYPAGTKIDGLRNCVLTPHPGECARLLHTTSKRIQSDRKAAAHALIDRFKKKPSAADRNIVVLKGADTLITDGESLRVNRTGNPGMATGGAGDVLTGVIAALIAQGMTIFNSAVLGAHVHGLAGDFAAREKGHHGLIASDLIEGIPTAMRAVQK